MTGMPPFEVKDMTQKIPCTGVFADPPYSIPCSGDAGSGDWGVGYQLLPIPFAFAVGGDATAGRVVGAVGEFSLPVLELVAVGGEQYTILSVDQNNAPGEGVIGIVHHLEIDGTPRVIEESVTSIAHGTTAAPELAMFGYRAFTEASFEMLDAGGGVVETWTDLAVSDTGDSYGYAVTLPETTAFDPAIHTVRCTSSTPAFSGPSFSIQAVDE